ncbi:hypothetical protein ASE01_12535 [Nocardioides sp. Root190]|uniref:DUF3093 domain-containing protein n=1 Tax=Nocardioides sp. Root190 TaxID=1736488 RepID=UPI0006F9A31C|nr:DUF3093 domain-containing protein [Nocardioides sp. Root190]KRB75877.1 hypothetical protein ASE01_12535 [Nocardioides sp. Root190]
MTQSAPTAYHERLRVPLRWWAQGTMFIATFWLAMVVALADAAPWLAWVVTGVLLSALALFLRSYGDARLVVADGWFRAGRARIEMHHIGAVDALDADETRRVSGRDADARAYLVLRPYLHRSVRVEITDPSDPAPYWLVSSRHPRALASALDAARSNTGQ